MREGTRSDQGFPLEELPDYSAFSRKNSDDRPSGAGEQ